MQIPIENIYYLLCYAWNKLDEKDRVAVNIDEKTKLVDLFAKVLLNASKILLKRGVDKSYIEVTEEIYGVKGKIEVNLTVRKNLINKQKTLCSYDEFSQNNLLNRILVTTIYRLIRTKGLDSKLNPELRKVLRMFFGIELIELREDIFKQIKLNRNNKFYGFIMNICQIIYECTLTSEKEGNFTFADFTRDENKMNQLFEDFIRNFYRLEQVKYPIVRRETINWQFKIGDNESMQYLPIMRTDITLENEDMKVVIDAKYYRETMNLHYDQEKIKSSNLYQLFSYLLNQENQYSKTINATGILIYPTIEKDYNLNYKYRSHDMQIRTVNLNMNWKKISSRLKEIIQVTE